MRFAPAFLDEIRTRVPCSQVCGRRVKLRKQGREWVGLSPFGNERTPSFFVNDQKAAWFDHSAGKHGDVFGFLIETEGLTFPEAVERLAREAGLTLPVADKESIKREARKSEIIDVMEAACDVFQHQLRLLSRQPAARSGQRDGSAEGEGNAYSYLAGRGVTPDEIAEFRIGYAPPDRAFLKQALHSAFGTEALCEAGLLIHGDDIPVPYDRFRGRIIFPILDQRGKVIAFSGRAMGDAKPKYHNSPDTLAFDKGRVLYNAHRARQAAWDGAPLLVTEGYMATIAATRAGFPATVATMGTALTEHHLASLWRMSDCPILCFDGDAAGRRAARKALDLALPMMVPGRMLRFALMPAGQDPDDVVRSRGGAAFGSFVEAALPLIDFLWRSYVEAVPAMSPDSRAKLKHDLDEAVRKVPDADLRREYFREIGDRIEAIPARPPVVRSNGHSNHSTSPSSIKLANGYRKRAGMNLRDAMIVSAMVAAPAVALDEIEAIASDRGLSQEAVAAVEAISAILGDLPQADSETLLQRLEAAGVGPTIAAARTICQDSGITSLAPGVDAQAAAGVLHETRH